MKTAIKTAPLLILALILTVKSTFAQDHALGLESLTDNQKSYIAFLEEKVLNLQQEVANCRGGEDKKGASKMSITVKQKGGNPKCSEMQEFVSNLLLKKFSNVQLSRFNCTVSESRPHSITLDMTVEKIYMDQPASILKKKFRYPSKESEEIAVWSADPGLINIHFLWEKVRNEMALVGPKIAQELAKSGLLTINRWPGITCFVNHFKYYTTKMPRIECK